MKCHFLIFQLTLNVGKKLNGRKVLMNKTETSEEVS